MDLVEQERALNKLFDRIKEGNECYELGITEKVYITRKILNLKTYFTEEQRKAIGLRILRKLWGEEIKGDTDSVKW